MVVARPPLYFIRHGETDWNVVKRYQGQTDTPLNDRGRGQAARNGEVLRGLLGTDAEGRVDFVASPLMRTSETMAIARASMGLPREGFRTDDRLKEIHFGHWEGLLWEDLANADPEGLAARLADPWHWQPRGGESYAMLARRVGAFLDEQKRPALVVSHGVVSRVVRGILLGLATSEIPRLEVPQDRVLVIADGRMRWA